MLPENCLMATKLPPSRGKERGICRLNEDPCFQNFHWLKNDELVKPGVRFSIKSFWCVLSDDGGMPQFSCRLPARGLWCWRGVEEGLPKDKRSVVLCLVVQWHPRMRTGRNRRE